jgi:hypothetical protein
MLTVTFEQKKRFVGLKEAVLYRLEIDAAMVDDGDRLYRIQRRPFEALLQNARAPEPVEASAEQGSLVALHPSIFELFEEAGRASQSLSAKEI